MSDLLEYLKKRHTQIGEQTTALSLQCRKQALHEWRVQVKKWRYALRMLGKIDPDFEAKTFLRPYKKLFAAAGAIREIQIQRDLMLRSKSELTEGFTHQYRKLLQHQYRSARTQFSKVARETALPSWQSLKKPLRAAVRQCQPLSCSWYFHQIIERISADWLNNREISDEALHDLRIQLKKYDASKKLLSHTLRYEAPPLRFLPLEMEPLLEQLGAWHDYTIAAGRLQEDLLSPFFSEAQRLEGRRLLRRWQRAAERLRASFHPGPHL
jgi:CHAD domain-containing protein